MKERYFFIDTTKGYFSNNFSFWIGYFYIFFFDSNFIVCFMYVFIER
jgi:hypothetical protein